MAAVPAPTLAAADLHHSSGLIPIHLCTTTSPPLPYCPALPLQEWGTTLESGIAEAGAKFEREWEGVTKSMADAASELSGQIAGALFGSGVAWSECPPESAAQIAGAHACRQDLGASRMLQPLAMRRVTFG